MKMKLFAALYILFSVLRVLTSWMLPKQPIPIFQVWYAVISFIWLILAVATCVLMLKIQKWSRLSKEWRKKEE